MLPAGDVRLAPGPFRDAQERDRAYLLELDPDRRHAGCSRRADRRRALRRLGAAG